MATGVRHMQSEHRPNVLYSLFTARGLDLYTIHKKNILYVLLQRRIGADPHILGSRRSICWRHITACLCLCHMAYRAASTPSALPVSAPWPFPAHCSSSCAPTEASPRVVGPFSTNAPITADGGGPHLLLQLDQLLLHHHCLQLSVEARCRIDWVGLPGGVHSQTQHDRCRI